MLRKVGLFLRWLESAVLVALFLTLLLVAVAQVLLRNIGELSFGLSWGDELMSMAVLWITLVGAMIAVRENGHIRVDIADRILPPRWSKPTSIVANLCASVVCFVITIFATENVWLEYTQPSATGIWVLPLWVLVAIFPFAFFVMGVRFALSIFVQPDE